MAPHGGDLYNQPWDYGQPPRYDGEEYFHYDYGRAEAMNRQWDDGAVRYQQPAYDPAGYNGSAYSVPGVNGPGYDLSGIISTNDFEIQGYDDPRYGRLSYDDPRYDDGARHAEPARSFDETRFDLQRYDETRVDQLWLAGDDVRRDGGTAGFGPGGGAVGHGHGPRSAETRYDMRALVETGARTRFDMKPLAEPGDNVRFDETRLDNLRGFAPERGAPAPGELALPAANPRGWAENTSVDRFAELGLADDPVPAAFNRALELPLREGDAPLSRRAGGKRRGRNGDKRQWMALGAIAVVAAGAIGGVLMKYVFSGPSGPSHTVAAPQTVASFTRSANLEKQLDVASEAAMVKQSSSGQASDVVFGVYQQGKLTPGTDTQMFMFVGGKLAGADPSASVASFEQKYPGAKTVSPGSFGGEEACTETTVNGQSASMCVWFDNDTFGTMMSPTMTTAKLASTMNTVRPSFEHVQD